MNNSNKTSESISHLINVIVPAAGVGARMQANCPKQYLKIGPKTILEHTLDKLLAHPRVGKIILALSEDDGYFDALAIANDPRVIRVKGGKERADSVLAGLHYLAQEQAMNQCNLNPWVLVHDAARPCVKLQDISCLIEHCEQQQVGGILAMRVKDTMKRSNDKNQVLKTVPRDDLWHALTPQMFPVQTLIQAIESGMNQYKTITDEASAMEMSGFKVALIAGNASNIKITHPEDLALAEFYLQCES